MIHEQHGGFCPDMVDFVPTWWNLSKHGGFYPNLVDFILTWWIFFLPW